MAAPREVFRDARGSSRVLRTSWHPEEDLVVLSIWEQQTCVTTFRLPRAAAPDLVHVLVEGYGHDGTASPSNDLPRTGTLRAAPSRAPEPASKPVPKPAPNPAPEPAPVSDQVRTEVQHLARHALDTVARVAVLLRDRVGGDPR